MSKKSVKKMRKKIRNEITNIMNNKSALGGTHTFIGLVSSNGGKIKVRIPDLNIFEMYDNINESVQNMQTRIEDELYYEYYKTGKPIPNARSANNFTPNRHETMRLFIARDPFYIKDRYMSKEELDEANGNIYLNDIIEDSVKENIKTNCTSAFINCNNKKLEEQETTSTIEEVKEENKKENIEKVKMIDVNKDNQSTMYKHICANPRCNKEFYLNPHQEYNQNRYRKLNPDANNLCCSKECAAEYRRIMNISSDSNEKIVKHTQTKISEEAKELYAMELHCANPECGKVIELTKTKVSSILSRIRKNPENKEHILSHLYCDSKCMRDHIKSKFSKKTEEIKKEDSNKEEIILTLTNKESDNIFEPIVKYLKEYGLSIDNINISFKVNK